MQEAAARRIGGQVLYFHDWNLDTSVTVSLDQDFRSRGKVRTLASLQNGAQLTGNPAVYTPVKLFISIFVLLSGGTVLGQGPRPTDLGASPQPVGDAGVARYTTWETALAEARRSNRPIFFMAAAATCNGISGVF